MEDKFTLIRESELTEYAILNKPVKSTIDDSLWFKEVIRAICCEGKLSIQEANMFMYGGK